MTATSAAGLPSIAGACEKVGDGFDRVLRGREADALQAVAAQSREPLQRQSEMGAALVGRDRVDFVDDHDTRTLASIARPDCEPSST